MRSSLQCQANGCPGCPVCDRKNFTEEDLAAYRKSEIQFEKIFSDYKARGGRGKERAK